MDKLTYTRDFDKELENDDIDTREAKEISFAFPVDLNINEFRIICIRIAGALGYSNNNIKECFNTDGKDQKSKALLSRVIKLK